jgi:septal ring factor EnvC (AmiA/AmiB activator)
MGGFFSPILEADDKTKALVELQQKIKQITEKLNDLKSEKNKLQADLKELDVKFGETTIQLKQLAEQVKKLKRILELNQQEMLAKQKEIDSQKTELERQVKLAYGMGNNKKLKLMLSQKDPTVSGRIMVYYDYLNKARLEQITRVGQSLQILRNLEEERIKETAALEDEEGNIKSERSKLLVTKSERKIILTKINKQFKSRKKQLSQFKANEKQLQSLVSSLQKTVEESTIEIRPVTEESPGVKISPTATFAELKRKLPWPVKGTITKKFGAKRSDSKWDGVLIKAKEGDDIRVVSGGLVVYADWLRGYGLLVIINHGQGYMTLYAFNQSLYKEVGERVEAGSVIAAVGQSGGQSNSGLYFGIRKKGKPVDPVKWCRKTRRGKIR